MSNTFSIEVSKRLREWEEEFDKGDFHSKTCGCFVTGKRINEDAGCPHVKIKSFIRSLLHQAELNWLTAQIERGEKMRRADWYKEGNRNNAIDEFTDPLIDRKKEVEKLLGKDKSS